jgi:hypothetical protein
MLKPIVLIIVGAAVIIASGFVPMASVTNHALAIGGGVLVGAGLGFGMDYLIGR